MAKVTNENIADAIYNLGQNLKDALMREHLLRIAAANLFDNRLGWSDGRNPYAPREIWAELGEALYGPDDPRVKELRALQIGDRVLDDLGQKGIIKAIEHDTYWVRLDWRPSRLFPYPVEDLKPILEEQ